MSNLRITESYSRFPHSLWSAAGLGLTAKNVLVRLEDFRNKETGQCNPRYEKLAARLGVCKDTIYEAIKKLVAAGLVEVHKGQRGNQFVIKPRSEWTAFLRPGKPDAEPVSASRKTRRARPGKPDAEAPHPYMNLISNEPKGEESAHEILNCVAPPVPNGGPAPPEPPGALFPLFWQCFVNAGVALSEDDRRRAKKTFERYGRDEQERIGKWVIDQLAGPWRSAEFTPNPNSALRSKGWLRAAGPRIVPKPMTKAEQSDAAIHAYFVWRDGGKVGTMP